jgi:hypothetical protein
MASEENTAGETTELFSSALPSGVTKPAEDTNDTGIPASGPGSPVTRWKRSMLDKTQQHNTKP